MMSTGRGQIWRRRSGTTFWIRSGLIIFIVLFIWVQVNFIDLGGSSPYPEFNDSQAALLSMIPVALHKFLEVKPRNATNLYGNGSYYMYKTLNISDIKRNIAQYNLQQTVHNEEIFGSIQNDSIVIVIQIHNRITYLRHLIISLAQARGISQAILVFSHDYYDEEINALVQSVDFCKVIQIFYPYSIQTHPREFPGEDPDDCPRDIKKEKALEINCNNALYPDLYGHYREARFTQTKHHWWWKTNYVFNHLEITRNYSGLVVFLEEDHYVAQDFIHILRLMEKSCKTTCQYCNILSLGTYLKTYNYYSDSKKKGPFRAFLRSKKISPELQLSWTFKALPSLYQHPQKVEITPWISSKHNMGMALNRSTWNEIVKCATFFCKYDDYNWDWSLQHTSQNCLNQKLYTMVARAPRVFHIGECGVHHKKKNCESTAVISKVQQVLKLSQKNLYPDYLSVSIATVSKKTKLRKGNGGWGDNRDHKLCLSMTIT